MCDTPTHRCRQKFNMTLKIDVSGVSLFDPFSTGFNFYWLVVTCILKRKQNFLSVIISRCHKVSSSESLN